MSNLYQFGLKMEEDEKREKALAAIERFNRASGTLGMAKAAGSKLKRLGDTPETTTRMGTGEQIPVAKGFFPSERQATAIQESEAIEQELGPDATDLDIAKREGLFASDAPEAQNLVSNLMREKQLEDTGGFGKSSVGAALAFTQSDEGQEIGTSLNKALDSLVKSPLFKEDDVSGIRELIKSDVRLAGKAYNDLITRPAIARRTVEEKTPAETILAGMKAQAAETGKSLGMKKLEPAAIQDIEGMKGGVRELDLAVDRFKDKFVGPILGRVGSVLEAIGLIGEEEAVFRETVQRFINELIKVRSGAAVSEQEMKRIREETLDFSLNPKTYMAKLESNMDFLKRKHDQYLEIQKKAGRNVSDFTKYSSTDTGSTITYVRDPKTGKLVRK